MFWLCCFCYRNPYNESTNPWGGKGAGHTFQSPEHSANGPKDRDLTNVKNE